jgi:small-conductance mechanosensitive channel
MGRILVAVTVEYASDAEQVRSLLLETARGHEKILSTPEPIVSLARFSPAGIDFELRAFVADILEGAGVASDIRFRLVARCSAKKALPSPSRWGNAGAETIGQAWTQIPSSRRRRAGSNT